MESYSDILGRLQDSFLELTGFNADDASDIGVRLKVLAGELFSLYSKLNYIKKQMFVQTAFGESLDNHALERGLERKASVKSKGVLTFSRTNALPYDITVPAGTVCCTGSPENGIRFETVNEGVLVAGTTYVDVEAVSLEGGKDKNVSSRTITIMVSPPSGITYVTNNSRFSGGVDEESDEELRERIIDSYKNVSNGTNVAFYKSEALKYDGVFSASVIPRARGTGTVDIYVAGKGELVSEDLRSKIQTEINKLREINVDVLVKDPFLVSVSTILYITVGEDYVFSEVRDKCVTEIENYYDSLKIGEPFLVADIAERVYHVEGVKNYSIPSTSTFDRDTEPNQLIVKSSIDIRNSDG